LRSERRQVECGGAVELGVDQARHRQFRHRCRRTEPGFEQSPGLLRAQQTHRADALGLTQHGEDRLQSRLRCVRRDLNRQAARERVLRGAQRLVEQDQTDASQAGDIDHQRDQKRRQPPCRTIGKRRQVRWRSEWNPHHHPHHHT
jgi:hypothetical protein